LRLLGSLRPVLGAALVSLGHADRVERAANHVITNARQVFHAASANEHDGVLLEVMADAGDVGRDFGAVGQTNARDLAERGVRLLRRGGVDARTDAALLRARLQRGRLGLVANFVAALTDELTDRWHVVERSF